MSSKLTAPVKPTRVRKAHAAAPESFLKRRKAIETRKAAALDNKKKAAVKARATHKDIFKRAEKYVAEYRAKELSTIRLARQAKATNQFFVQEEAKVVFAIRIKGTYGVSPKVRKILQLLRLRQINNGVFIKVNKASLNMLTLVAPYVTWGRPNTKTVSDLVYKRGYGKVDKKRVPLTDNSIIEGSLGKLNIICTEDLIHEIFTCGPNFKQANSFLWPFKLNTPLGGWEAKKIHFAEGGDAGDRKDEINPLVRRMC